MSLVNTRLQNLRANSNLDKNELRPSRYGALDLFMKQTEDPSGIITEELLEKAKNSIGNQLQTPAIVFDGDISIGDFRNVIITDSENTSVMININFTTYAWGFTTTPAQHMNNEIALQRDFETKFNKYLYKFADTVDTGCVTTLGANKTQKFVDLLNFTQSGNVVQIPWRLRETALGNITPMMAANDHFGQIHVVGNAGIESLMLQLAKGGEFNAVNNTIEYSDKILHYTTRILNANGKFATFFGVQGGSVGLLTRFEREALLGTTMQDGTTWGIDTLPLLNFPVGTYFYESKGDNSYIGGAATADMTRTRKEHYGFAVDVAYLTVYNSSPSTIANPIMQFVINAETSADYQRVVIANESGNPVFTDEVA